MMDVMIGVDPHKGSHTATMLDRAERELTRITVRAGRRQVEQLLEWANGYTARTWAVECAGGMGYLLSQQLVAAGETVLDVPATLASRVRVLGTGQSTKTDPNDARSVAVAALHAPTLAAVRPADHVTVCRLLAKHHTDLARWRTKLCCRLHALVGELVAGGINKEVVVNQARSLLDGIQPEGVAAVERHRQAVELVADLEHLDIVIQDSRARITAAVTTSGTTLTEIFGVGPIVAAMLIGYTGDPLRFTTANRYAAYNGTAPIEFSSGGRVTHRLSRRGNRRLNHAIHCAAITQVRHRHSPGRAYYERKLAEGHTPREAIRSLKRRLSDIVWRHLVADAGRAAVG
jgi:transposase